MTKSFKSIVALANLYVRRRIATGYLMRYNGTDCLGVYYDPIVRQDGMTIITTGTTKIAPWRDVMTYLVNDHIHKRKL